MRLQVRSIDGSVFWVDTSTTATIGSIKQSIQSARGIDVIMQKLICVGRLLADDSTPELYGISERDFLVLVTAKPRPPSLVSTGAPLPSSYQSYLHGGIGDPGVDEEEEEDDDDDDDAGIDGHGLDGDDPGEDGALERDAGADGEGMRLGCDRAHEEDEVARFVEMGFSALDAERALRISSGDPSRALSVLRSGRVNDVDEAVRNLEGRLRSLPTFHALQQVVRVDPQIMVRASRATRRAAAGLHRARLRRTADRRCCSAAACRRLWAGFAGLGPLPRATLPRLAPPRPTPRPSRPFLSTLPIVPPSSPHLAPPRSPPPPPPAVAARSKHRGDALRGPEIGPPHQRGGRRRRAQRCDSGARGGRARLLGCMHARAHQLPSGVRAHPPAGTGGAPTLATSPPPAPHRPLTRTLPTRPDIARRIQHSLPPPLPPPPPPHLTHGACGVQVRDTLCSLMPPHWEEQLMLASEYAEQMRTGIISARSRAVELPPALVASYMRAVSEQVRCST